jgi:signal transduction histidine kinase
MQPSAQKNHIRYKSYFIPVLVLVYLMTYLAWQMIVNPLSTGLTTLIFHLFPILPGILAITLFIHTCIRQRNRLGWITGFAAAGLVCWLAGDILQYFVTGNISKYLLPVSIMRWMNLAGWAFFLGSILLLPIFQKRIILRLKIMLDLVISTGAFVLLSWLILTTQIGNYSTLSSSTGITLDPILDLILIGLSVNLVLLSRNTPQKSFFIFFILAMIFFCSSDFASLFSSDFSTSSSATALNITNLLGCSMMVMAARFGPKSVSELETGGVEAGSLAAWTLGERIQTTLPIALPFVLVGELLVFWQMDQQIDQGLLVSASIIWLLLIVRLGVSAGEFELQRYAILFENSTEPAFLCDSRLKIILVNPAMVQICGKLSEDTLLGQPITRFIRTIHPVSLSKQGWSSEGELISRVDMQIPIDLSLKQIELGFFKQKLVTGTLHDLTDQKLQQSELQTAYDQVSHIQSELKILNDDLESRIIEKTGSLSQAIEQLEEQHRQLQSLDKLKSDFVSLVSHELRAPLTNISGGIELILTGKKPLPEYTRQSLLLVQSEIQRLTRFVETILDLSALDAGKMPFFLEPVRLSEILPSLQTRYKSSPQGNRLVWNIPENFEFILADRQALMSVFEHLIDNGLKYAPEGPVEISAIQKPDIIQVTVADQGPGIPPAYLKEIFEQFFRTENTDSRVVYGHGLGLYIARKLLQAMNGDIQADNRDSGGAIFTFWLPLEKNQNEK